MCCVITDQNDVVVSISLIPGTEADVPFGGHLYFPVKEDWPRVGCKFVPDFTLQPWLLGKSATIVDVDFGNSGNLQVVRVGFEMYDVIVDGEIKHPKSSATDVMRALGHYIQSLNHKVNTLSGGDFSL